MGTIKSVRPNNSYLVWKSNMSAVSGWEEWPVRSRKKLLHDYLPPACPASGTSLKTLRTLRFCYFTESGRTIR